MRTAFEQKAHDIQYRKKNRISYPHSIETYTGNNQSTGRMVAEIVISVLIGIVFILLAMAVTN
jgi:uncharacterized membrane protein